MHASLFLSLLCFLLSVFMESISSSPVAMFTFPCAGGGHQIPMIDIARIFACHGDKSTIITASKHALSFQKSINNLASPFPSGLCTYRTQTCPVFHTPTLLCLKNHSNNTTISHITTRFVSIHHQISQKSITA